MQADFSLPCAIYQSSLHSERSTQRTQSPCHPPDQQALQPASTRPRSGTTPPLRAGKIPFHLVALPRAVRIHFISAPGLNRPDVRSDLQFTRFHETARQSPSLLAGDLPQTNRSSPASGIRPNPSRRNVLDSLTQMHRALFATKNSSTSISLLKVSLNYIIHNRLRNNRFSPLPITLN